MQRAAIVIFFVIAIAGVAALWVWPGVDESSQVDESPVEAATDHVETAAEVEAVAAVVAESVEPAIETQTPAPEGVLHVLSGHVRDARDDPVDGATITVRGPVDGATVTAPDGSYAIGELPAGRYTVRFTHPNYETTTDVIELAESRLRNVILEGRFRVRGRVTEADTGLAVPMYRVNVLLGEEDPLDRNVRTFPVHETNGQYAAGKFIEAPVSIEVTGAGYEPKRVPLEDVTADRGVFEVDVELVPRSDGVLGFVRDEDGAGVAGARLYWNKPQYDAMAWGSVAGLSGEDGRFQTDPPRDSAVRLYAVHPDLVPGFVDLPVGRRPAEIVLGPAGVLVVTLMEGGRVALDTKVRVAYGDTTRLAAVNEDAEWIAGQLPPGPVEVFIEQASRQIKRQQYRTAVIRANETARLAVDFSSGAGGTLTGHVTPKQGLSGNVSVMFVASTGGVPVYQRSTQTDEHGDFTLEDVPAGPGSIRFTYSMQDSANQQYIQATQAFDVDVVQGGTTHVDVELGLTGAVVRGALIADRPIMQASVIIYEGHSAAPDVAGLWAPQEDGSRVEVQRITLNRLRSVNVQQEINQVRPSRPQNTEPPPLTFESAPLPPGQYTVVAQIGVLPPDADVFRNNVFETIALAEHMEISRRDLEIDFDFTDRSSSTYIVPQVSR